MSSFFKKHGWLFVLIGASTFIFFIVEWRYPLFFLHDDNYYYNLPNFVNVWSSLIQGGELSLYNFHQYLGIPTLSMGQPAVLYPFNYLSTALSLLFTSSFYWSIDIFAYIHITTGIVGMFILLKRIGLDHALALFGAIAWGVSNYTWFVGNAWCQVLSITMYFPFMVYFSLRLFQAPQKKWVAALVIIRLLNFFVGHPQFFIYTCIAESLIIALLLYHDYKRGEKHGQFIKSYLLSYVCVFFLALPLLLPLFYQMQISWNRSSVLNVGEVIGPFDLQGYLEGLFFPRVVEEWPGFRTIAFTGIIPAIICTIYLVKMLWFYINNKKHNKDKWLNISSKLLFFYLLWTSGVVAIFLYYVPILNRFRWPFKNIIFVNFFAVLCACILLNEITKNLKHRSLVLTLLIIVQFSGSIYALGFNGFYSFGDRNESVPYSAEVLNKIDDNKAVSFGFQRKLMLPAQTLLGNHATFFSKYHFGGYEVLISQKQMDATLYSLPWNGLPYNGPYKEYIDMEIPDMINRMREWGVNWYITANDYVYPQDFGFIETYKNDILTLYKDPYARPIFYFKNEVSPVKDYNIGYSSIKIKIDSQKDDNLVVNFIHKPFFNAFINGSKIELRETELGQMMLDVPMGEHEILIKYNDPYFIWGCVTSSMFLISLIIVLVLFRCRTSIKNKKICS